MRKYSSVRSGAGQYTRNTPHQEQAVGGQLCATRHGLRPISNHPKHHEYHCDLSPYPLLCPRVTSPIPSSDPRGLSICPTVSSHPTPGGEVTLHEVPNPCPRKTNGGQETETHHQRPHESQHISSHTQHTTEQRPIVPQHRLGPQVQFPLHGGTPSQHRSLSMGHSLGPLQMAAAKKRPHF